MSGAPARVLGRRCFRCGAGTGRGLFSQRFARIEGGSVLDGYQVVACERCGTAFADGVPEQAALDRYYRELSKYENPVTAGVESPADGERFAEVARELVPFVPPHARILEIGCAGGGLLAALRDLGLPDVHGVDPSSACAAAAVRNHGLEARAGTLWDTGHPPGSFDLVVLIAVLEHLRDVGRAMRALRAMLRPGGLLHLEVPDATRFAEFAEAPYQQFSVEHLNYFSPASLAGLAAAHGFSPVASWRAVREVGRQSREPVVAATFRLSDRPPDAPDDVDGPRALETYIALSAQREAPLRRRAEAIAGRGEPLLVWSVGTQALRLVANTALGEAPIVAFVDSNPRYVGKSVRGRPIVSPNDLAGRLEPILIASTNYEREILSTIRERLRLGNDVLTLAGDGS